MSSAHPSPWNARTGVLMVLVLLAAALFAPPATAANAAPAVTLSDDMHHLVLGKHIGLLEDPGGTLTWQEASSDVLAPHYQPGTTEVPNLGFINSTYWIKLRLTNTSRSQTRWYLEYADPMFQHIEVYAIDQSGRMKHFRSGSMEPPSADNVAARTHVFPLDMNLDSSVDVYVKARTGYAFMVQLHLWHPEAYAVKSQHETLLHGLYVGITLAMILSNLSFLIAMREKPYLYYVLFMLCAWINNSGLNGTLRQYILNDSPAVLDAAFVLSFNLCEILATLFTLSFLNAPRYARLLGLALIVSNFASVIAWISGNMIAWTASTTIIGFLGSLCLLFIGIGEGMKGNLAARYYSTGFGCYLAGGIITTASFSGFMPVNLYTYSAMEIGSALEAIILSLALSSRMRHMRATQDAAQKSLADIQKKNLEIQQNYSRKLEQDVHARTAELVDTQQKLVASEKRAALGVFTAGIAHEINNPANFVAAGTQNVTTQIGNLKAFIGELLDEDTDADITQAFNTHFSKIDSSVEVITTGIHRITDVVKTLRAANPEGETGRQPTDIVALLEQSWQWMQPSLSILVSTTIDAQARPLVPVQVTDMQQGFMALLGNAVHAIEDAIAAQQIDAGHLAIASHCSNDTLVITLHDNGTGIADDVIDKVFDPFFTTKAVGRGQGLGLSMARDVVLAHGGTLELASTPGNGTCAIITLPLSASC